MPSISGTYVGSGLSPGNVLNTHETHRAKFGQGGYRTVASLLDRNNITPLRREEGMLVFVISEDIVYKLKGGAPLTGPTTDSDWEVFNSGSGGGGTPIVGSILASAYYDLELGEVATFASSKYVISLVTASKAYGVEVFVSKDHTELSVPGFSKTEYSILGDILHNLDLVIAGPNLYLRITNNELDTITYTISNDLVNIGGGTGDVNGPGSSTDNAIVRFDGATGKLIQNSGVTLSDTDDILNVSRLSLNNLQLTSTNTLPISPQEGDVYFDLDYKCLMFYDASRSKWLSSDSYTYTLSSDNSSIGAGVSLRLGITPTSTTPLPLGSSDVCLVELMVSTSSTEDFTLAINDIVVGTNTYSFVIPSGTVYSSNSVDENFDAGNAIEVFIESLGSSGNIDRPVVTMVFRRRK